MRSTKNTGEKGAAIKSGAVWGTTRLGALLVILLSIKVIYFEDMQLWLALYFSVLAGHYVLSFYAVKSQISSLLSTWAGFIAILGTVLITIAVFVEAQGVIMFSFALHFGLSEAYSKRVQDPTALPQKNRAGRWFIGMHIALNALIFLTAFWHNFRFFGPRDNIVIEQKYYQDCLVLMVCALIGYLIMFFGFHKSVFKEKLNTRSVFNYLVPEIVYIALIPFFRHYDINYAAGVFYHLVFWLFAPVLKQNFVFRSGTKAYARTTILVTLAFFVFTPYLVDFYLEESKTNLRFILGYRIDWADFLVLFGLFHIHLSVLFSELNPEWVERLKLRLQESRPIFRSAPIVRSSKEIHN